MVSGETRARQGMQIIIDHMLLANPITAKAFPPTITQISPKRLAREDRSYKTFKIVKF
jgi:hypothetical protein